MGLSSTKLNCLVLGLDGVGKTTILYGMRLEETNKTFKETVGFNYEIINQVYKGKVRKRGEGRRRVCVVLCGAAGCDTDSPPLSLLPPSLSLSPCPLPLPPALRVTLRDV